MGYNIELCKTGKRENSTAQAPAGTVVNASLKNGVSVLSPEFYLNTGDDTFNYIKFNGRGYWVRDKIWERQSLMRAVCEVDVLGSWKSSILGTTAYVVHSASNYNINLKDSRLMTHADSVISTWQGDDILIFDYENGKYITGVIGKPNRQSPSGMTCVYALDADAASALAVAFNEGDAIQQITMQFGSAFNSLIFCRWVPLSVPEGEDATISLADYNTGITGTFIAQRYIQTTMQVLIPWYSSDFRRVEPYSYGYLFLPYVGVVSLELSNLTGMDSMLVRVTADTYTGDIVYKIGSETNPLAVYSGNCAVEIPINSYQRDWKGVVQSGVNTLVNVAGTALQAGMAAVSAGIGAGAAGAAGGTGGMSSGQAAGLAGASRAAGGFGGVVGGIADTAMSYFTFNTGSKGGFSGGCGSGLGLKPQCVVVTHKTSQEPSAMASVMGRPCGKTLRIGDLTGFVQTSGFRVSGNMTKTEKEIIDAYMDRGVYIE